MSIPNISLAELSLADLPPWATTSLLSIGAVGVAWATATVLSAAWLFARPSSLPKALHPSGQRYLTYALVTGSTDGIGLEMARELSARGFALVLHGRNPDKLARVAAEIVQAHGGLGAPEPRLLVADADKANGIDFEELVEPLRGLRITVLANNVGGMGHITRDPFRTFDSFVRDDADKLIQLNALFMVHLTRALLPVLYRATDPASPESTFEYPVPLERPAPGRAPTAYVLNASSAAALGVPYVVPYAACKGFVESFGAALKAELQCENKAPPTFPASLVSRHSGPRVDVLGLRIGSVVTTGNPVDQSFWAPSAAVCARAIMERVGCGYDVVEAYFGHWLQVTFFTGLLEAAVGQWSRRAGIVMNARWVKEARAEKLRKES